MDSFLHIAGARFPVLRLLRHSFTEEVSMRTLSAAVVIPRHWGCLPRGLTLACGAFLLVVLLASPASSTTLWYNGDFDGYGGIGNGVTTSAFDPLLNELVYEDFVVNVTCLGFFGPVEA
jgi:hypothetical protein